LKEEEKKKAVFERRRNSSRKNFHLRSGKCEKLRESERKFERWVL
jgi:hypothetical protein